MIEVEGEPDEILSIRVNGESLHSFDDGETWVLPKGLIGDALVNQLPETAVFEICNHVEKDSTIIMDTIPIRVQRIGDNRVQLDFEDSGTRKYWDGTFGFRVYMEAKKGIVEERAAQAGDVALVDYEDDGAWIHLFYSAEAEVEKISTAVELAEQIVEQIERAAEMRLRSELCAPREIANPDTE